MARPLRIKFEGAWYHVMNRGANRQRIFFNKKHKNAFLNYIAKTIKIYGIEIHAYCLMDNHYHLVIHTPRCNISEAMKYLNSSYARYLNISEKKDGPVFRGRFKAIVVAEDDYLLALSRYIHRNPLTAKIVADLKKYEWSSYPDYLAIRKKPDWLHLVEIIHRFGKNRFVDHYKQYVESENNTNESESFFNNKENSVVLGSDQFRHQIDEYVKLHSLSAEIVGADRILIPADIDTITKLVAEYFKISPASIRTSSRGIRNDARNMCIYICREFGGYKLADIATLMGNVSYKAISSSICRFESDKVQIKIANDLIEKLKKKARRLSECNQVVG